MYCLQLLYYFNLNLIPDILQSTVSPFKLKNVAEGESEGTERASDTFTVCGSSCNGERWLEHLMLADSGCHRS